MKKVNRKRLKRLYKALLSAKDEEIEYFFKQVLKIAEEGK